VVRESVHKLGYGHKQAATTASVVAGGFEARGCGGELVARYYDVNASQVFAWRRRYRSRGDLIKIIWHEGIGMSLQAKRLKRGRFVWPWPADGTLAILAARLA
jgi:IS66 Orf2 like protein